MLLIPFSAANAQNSLVGDVNKDGSVNIADVTMVVDIILNGQKELSLSVNEISLDAGNSATIVITSGYGSYTVSCTDTNIADAMLVGSMVIINGKNVGTTVVKIIDTISGNMEEVCVKVLSPLSFSANSAELDVGETMSIDIISGNGNYEVTSSNAIIVDVSLSGTTIVLTGNAEGVAKVKVKDVVTGCTEEITVTVTYSDPPVSYTACPDENHPHLIDLGLPSGTKWACCNVGADKPEAYGGYYAWGETEEKDYYDWNTYIHCDGSYNTCHDLGSDISGLEYDVAHVKWCGKWVMPTNAEQKELLDNCIGEWTTLNGVNGWEFTSKINGNSIFLPAAGSRVYDNLRNVGTNGNYWSSTQYPWASNRAYYLKCTSDSAYCSFINRHYGWSVRPVLRN